MYVFEFALLKASLKSAFALAVISATWGSIPISSRFCTVNDSLDELLAFRMSAPASKIDAVR